jgi:superfamily II RNA helicase
MFYGNYRLDRFQEEAVASIDAHHTVIVAAPTGAGKTLIAEYAVEKCINQGRRVIYTAPIKVLSNQKYRDFSAKYGDDEVGILTGDVAINANAPVRIMTTEIFRNSIFEDPEGLSGVDYVVLDEIHYIDNEERGTVWEESLIFAPQEISFICLSATMPNLTELASWMKTVRRRDVDVVNEISRPVPLEHAIYTDDFGVGNLEDLDLVRRKPLLAQNTQPEWAEVMDKVYEADLIDYIIDQKKLPCLYFSSSRKACEDRALDNADRDLLTDEERQRILHLYDQICIGHDMSSDKGAMVMRDIVARGVAYHHAGMLPTMKEIVEQTFASGLLKLLFTTETFAVGVNMPACTVVFDSPEKYDGIRMRPLKAREYQQMAGRAGRRGIDKRGFVYIRIDPDEIDLDLARKIVTGVAERIESRFNLCYSSILNLYSRHGEDIYEVCEKSYGRFQAAERLERLQKQMDDIKAQTSQTIRCIRNDLRNIGEYQKMAREVKERRWSLKRQIRQIRNEHKDDKRLRDQKLQQVSRDFQRLEEQLKKTVCYNCPELNECIQTERRVRTARRTYANLAEEIGRIESYQPEQVKKRLNLLRSLGYTGNGELSVKGRAASYVYGYELQTAELLFNGFFDRMDEDQINILATAIIFESREREWYKPAPKSLLGDVFYKADKCIDQLRRREQLFGIKGIQVKSLDASLTSAVYAWSKENCGFEDLAKYTDASEGDLVRAFRMTIDLLRQTQRAIAGHNALRERLESSIKKMNRGVVDAEKQLRIY